MSVSCSKNTALRLRSAVQRHQRGVQIKLLFRLALKRAASDKFREITNVTLDLGNSFLTVCCVACPRYGSTCFENGGVADLVSF